MSGTINKMKNFYIGTSGYNYKHWKEVFYPRGLSYSKWLNYYSQHFSTVEINATFYGNFRRTVFEKWKEETGDDFIFTLKGPRLITHTKKLNDIDESLGIFLGNTEGLGKKLNMILWQFPPSFKCETETLGRLKEFRNKLPKNIRQAFEFRHKSWYETNMKEELQKNKINIVIAQSKRFPEEKNINGDFYYIRFHGPQRLYSSSYSPKELLEWANFVKNETDNKDVYCYFNNDVRGFAVRNAKELSALVIS